MGVKPWEENSPDSKCLSFVQSYCGSVIVEQLHTIADFIADN